MKIIGSKITPRKFKKGDKIKIDFGTYSMVAEVQGHFDMDAAVFMQVIILEHSTRPAAVGTIIQTSQDSWKLA
jgi:hypothetical protein